MEEQTINTLVEPFPDDAIRSRRGGHGKELRYLETWRIIDRLNRAFAHNWTFRILEWKVMENEVVVHAELEAAGVSKQAFGGSTITRNRDTGEAISIGDDVKAASSDALKKASTSLGVGLAQLYGSREAGKQESKPLAAVAPRAPDRNGRATDRQVQAILAVAQQRGMSEPEIRTRVLDNLGVSLERLGRREASEMITKLSHGNGRAVGGAA